MKHIDLREKMGNFKSFPKGFHYTYIKLIFSALFILVFLLINSGAKIEAIETTHFDISPSASVRSSEEELALVDVSNSKNGNKVKNCWCNNKLIRTSAVELSRQHQVESKRTDIVKTALNMQGPQGYFDCSLFVQTVMAKNGIEVPRSTFQYSTEVGELIEEADILPGDIVLYDSEGWGNPSHVGIMWVSRKFAMLIP